MSQFTLKTNTGSVLVPILDENDKKIGEMRFIPTDVDILERYSSVIEFFNNVKFSKNPTDKELIEFSENIKNQFDYLFNYPVANEIFSVCNPLTVIENGDFFFENIMEGIAGLIESILNQRVEKKMKKIRKATAKYKK